MVKNSPKLARLGRGVLHALRKKGSPLSRFVPRTFGGDYHNIWTDFVYLILRHSICDPIYRKPLWDFVKDNKCNTVLEIGLGNGRNTEKMISLAGDGCKYYVFDNLAWPESKKAFKRLSCRKNIYFYIGDTRETLPNNLAELPKMDLIFIDGGHDYETCKSDWKNCKQLMHSKTACFFHDYSPIEGVKRVVDEINDGFSVKIIRLRAGPHFAFVRRSMNG